jgi:pseudouridine-5'-phosphate glycosidase
MPYPHNVQTALEVEQLVREYGAIPATIGIIKGRIKIGLSAEELDYFAQAQGIEKVSRRDFPQVVALGKDGATTVAGTMICAAMAGIAVFVTGGIGGVHRGVEQSLDISADLVELKQTSVAVVCAGVKAILDIPKTLEVLETAGVPVIGFQCDEFPAFYTPHSHQRVELRLDSAAQVAQLLRTKWALGLKGGVLIANPVPAAEAMDEQGMETAIAAALGEAEARGIRGKAITPFLLERLVQLSGGQSLKTNIALIKNNAKVGAQIAVALAAAEAAATGEAEARGPESSVENGITRHQ